MKLSKKLLQYYEKQKRDLPWRKTISPYNILVSEIMLQQTQVDRVKDYYKAWLEQFPDWDSLANASNAEVISAWQGLGYNRRALALRDIAKQVVNTGVPQDRKSWLNLKGIGPYTSAAIALFAQGEKVFPVDSIIRRVMGRVFAGIPFPTPEYDHLIEDGGARLLNEVKNYRDIPQAIFDLGTSICKKDPLCKECPLKNDCEAANRFLSGDVVIPKRSIKKANEHIHRNKKYPDRIFRGRIVRFVSKHGRPVHLFQLGKEIDDTFDQQADSEWLEQMVARLVKDGMVRYKDEYVRFID